MSDVVPVYGVEQQSLSDRAYLIRATPAGLITGFITCSWDLASRQPLLSEDEVHVLVPEGIAEAVEADFTLWRVVGGEVVARPSMTPSLSSEVIAADGQEECVISGLPDPCRIRCSGAIEVPWTLVTGGVVALTASVPGTVAVRVTAPPAYRPWEGHLRAD